MGNGQSRSEKRASGEISKFTFDPPEILVEPPTPSTSTLNGLETLDYDARPGPGSGVYGGASHDRPLALESEFAESESVTWVLRVVQFVSLIP